MYFQEALVFIMNSLEISLTDFSHRLDANPRWIAEISTNPEWKPKLDTIFKICFIFNIDIITFLKLAEFGVIHNPNFGYKNICTYDKIYLVKPITNYQKYLILQTKPYHIAQALRAFRLEKGYSQKKLMQITSFSTNSISLRESKRYVNYPTITTLLVYCSAFTISISSFVSRVLLVVDEEEKNYSNK